MFQDVTNDGGSVFFPMVFILSVCAALITIDGDSCYFHGWRNLFQSGGAQLHMKKTIEKFCGLNWQP